MNGADDSVGDGADGLAGSRGVQGCAVDLYGLVRTVAKRVGRVDLALFQYRPAACTALNTVVRRARGHIARQAARLATRVGAPAS